MNKPTKYTMHRLKRVITITHIINISYYKFPKNFVFGGEAHDFWEFIYIDKGEMIITAGEQDYLLKAGELAFHKPREFHDVRASGRTLANATVIAFVSKSRAMRYFHDKILFLNDFEKELLTSVVREAKRVFTTLENTPPSIMLNLSPDAPFGSDQMIVSQIEQLLISIRRRGDSISTKQRTMAPKLRQNYKKITLDVLNILENSMGEKLTLKDISRRLNISVSLLKQVFRKETGKSIIDYLIDIRVGEAKRLISEGIMNFTEIAEHLGYGNIYYFSRAFKAKTGMTPTEYAQSVEKTEF
ncbi:MAG: AraC family transcriptional regulator [Clostridiales bacterium]|nr:AraC family transcriptional regulator [Clostridiales bacterium]